MSDEDQDDGQPDDAAVVLLVGSLEKTQITDQQGNLEKADAQLVEWATCKVDTRV